MANGTIAFDTLQTSGQITGTARSIDADYLLNGSGKFWILHNDGATVSNSFNHSSMTAHGTGGYSNTFTNNMSGADAYSISGHAHAINDKTTFVNMMSSNAALSASNYRYQTGYVANTSGGQTNHDCDSTSIQVHGDLA